MVLPIIMPHLMERLEKLLDILEKDIDRFNDESKKHKRIFRSAQTIVICLTAVTTVTAGAGLLITDAAGKNIIQFCVLALSATVTGLTSWNEMRRARELWQHEREIYYALVDIRRSIDFYSTNREPTDAEIDSYFERISSVLGSSAHKWGQIQSRKEK